MTINKPRMVLDGVGQDQGRLVGLNRDIEEVVQDCDLADYSALEADVAWA